MRRSGITAMSQAAFIITLTASISIANAVLLYSSRLRMRKGQDTGPAKYARDEIPYRRERPFLQSVAANQPFAVGEAGILIQTVILQVRKMLFPEGRLFEEAQTFP